MDPRPKMYEPDADDSDYHPEDNPPAWTPTLERCKGCNAAVFFVPAAASGKTNIIDYAPVDGGNVAIISGLAVFHRNDAPLPDDVPHYISHWATCPSAGSIREQLAARDREARSSSF